MERSEWDEPLVHSISTAQISRRDDHDQRVRTYLMSMGIRTGSFVLAALFAFVLDVPWAAWLFMFLAVVLPYPAVVWANNRDRHVTAPGVQSPLDLSRSIGAEPTYDTDDAMSERAPHTVPGETVGPRAQSPSSVVVVSGAVVPGRVVSGQVAHDSLDTDASGAPPPAPAPQPFSWKG